MLRIITVLVKYKLFYYFDVIVPPFLLIKTGKKIVRDKILAFESEKWSQFCESVRV